MPLKSVKRCVASSGAGGRGWLASIRLLKKQPLLGEVMLSQSLVPSLEGLEMQFCQYQEWLHFTQTRV